MARTPNPAATILRVVAALVNLGATSAALAIALAKQQLSGRPHGPQHTIAVPPPIKTRKPRGPNKPKLPTGPIGVSATMPPAEATPLGEKPKRARRGKAARERREAEQRAAAGLVDPVDGELPELADDDLLPGELAADEAE